jgi:hypothetical protein
MLHTAQQPPENKQYNYVKNKHIFHVVSWDGDSLQPKLTHLFPSVMTKCVIQTLAYMPYDSEQDQHCAFWTHQITGYYDIMVAKTGNN